MPMTGKKSNPLGAPNLHFKNGAFYYVHRGTRRWERLGTDIAEARRKANLYNEVGLTYGTMAYSLESFLVHFEKLVNRGERAKRTLEDYKRDVEPLKLFFGAMTPSSIEPPHVGQYLDIGAESGRAVRANREKALLSACFTWLIRTPGSGVKSNPCIGVKRNKETPRERYVEHDEFHTVYDLATRQVRGLMDLVYRTLQRPEDIIKWTPANIINKVEPNGSTRRVIRNVQDKTGAHVDIAITDEIDAILRDLKIESDPKKKNVTAGPGMPIIHTQSGHPYTYDGLSSMLRRYIKKAGVKSFGFYDMKGKGATDMWLAGVPLELIQALCGHESIKTTEVYVKSRWRGTIEPNQVDIQKHKKAENS